LIVLLYEGSGKINASVSYSLKQTSLKEMKTKVDVTFVMICSFQPIS